MVTPRGAGQVRGIPKAADATTAPRDALEDEGVKVKADDLGRDEAILLSAPLGRERQVLPVFLRPQFDVPGDLLVDDLFVEGLQAVAFDGNDSAVRAVLMTEHGTGQIREEYLALGCLHQPSLPSVSAWGRNCLGSTATPSSSALKASRCLSRTWNSLALSICLKFASGSFANREAVRFSSADR